MFQSAEIIQGLCYTLFGVAPITVDQEELLTPKEASLVFSESQFLVVLVTSVVMPNAFQLLFKVFF